MEHKLRIGVIGLGIMGEQYVRVFRGHPLAEVVAVASRTPERASAIAARYGIPNPCATWQDLVERADVDAVYVATPDHLHYQPARAALEHGKHVLIEKPMTLDLDEADAMISLARKSGRKVQVAFNHRWLSSYYHGRAAIA
ncbi:MAG: Gfo/Idh/MocA family oxidoreductase, partial [Acidobacteria bacterium]|nr:Gfo/Idh/MocA family oxidoreductase [Acidobacteriota bacterium]